MKDWIIKKLGGYTKHQLDETRHRSYVKGVRESADDYEKELVEARKELKETQDRLDHFTEQARRMDFSGALDHFIKKYETLRESLAFPAVRTYTRGDVLEPMKDTLEKTVRITWYIEPISVYVMVPSMDKIQKDTVKEYYRNHFDKEVVPMMYSQMMSSIEKMKL